MCRLARSSTSHQNWAELCTAHIYFHITCSNEVISLLSCMLSLPLLSLMHSLHPAALFLFTVLHGCNANFLCGAGSDVYVTHTFIKWKLHALIGKWRSKKKCGTFKNIFVHKETNKSACVACLWFHLPDTNVSVKMEQSKVSLFVWRYNKRAKGNSFTFFLSLLGFSWQQSWQKVFAWKQKIFCRFSGQFYKKVDVWLQKSWVTSWSWNAALCFRIDEDDSEDDPNQELFQSSTKKSVPTCEHVPVPWRWREGPKTGKYSRGSGTMQAGFHSPCNSRTCRLTTDILLSSQMRASGRGGKGLGMLQRTFWSLHSLLLNKNTVQVLSEFLSRNDPIQIWLVRFTL